MATIPQTLIKLNLYNKKNVKAELIGIFAHQPFDKIMDYFSFGWQKDKDN